MAGDTNRGPLGELITTICEANDWSYADVANRAIKSLGPGAVSKQNVSRLANEYPLRSITRTAVQALAAGLGISPDRVALAAVQAMGFRPPVADLTPAEAISRDPGLSVDTKAALLAILRSTAERRGA